MPLAQGRTSGHREWTQLVPSTEVRYLDVRPSSCSWATWGLDDIGELRRLIIGLVTDERKTVVLDMSHLRELHESSVEVIIEARRYLVTRGGELVLRAPVPAYFRVLVGLDARRYLRHRARPADRLSQGGVAR